MVFSAKQCNYLSCLMSLLSFFRNVCFPKPVNIIITYNSSLYQNVPYKPLFLYTLYMFCLEAKSYVSFYLSLPTSLALSPCLPHHLCFFPFHFSFLPRYPFHLTLFSPSFLSGALVDWVQLPDDDGTSAERKPKRDGGRPLHTSRLSAEMEGLYTRLSVCITNIFKWNKFNI